MKVFMGSHFVDGIRRVVDALRAGLPEHGITVVDDPREADLLAIHGADRVPRDDLPLVAHTHGLMWSDYRWRQRETAEEVNARIISAMTRADAITAPSRWVRNAITRGMLRRPEVVYHGVDTDSWAPASRHSGYILWNKARIDEVSDPRPLNSVAGLLPDVPFVTTIGRERPNVQVVGPQSYGQMRDLVRGAAVYLATTRETFGIGTLEALASGVPVVGYRFGGQEEIIVEGETGYLVTPGDDAALADAIEQALSERARLSANARADALARWQWPDKVAQYAALYQQVLGGRQQARPTVSVIITCYNLGCYLEDAIGSVLTADEVIIVDDCSTDNTADTVDLYSPHRHVHYYRTPQNLGLSGARNYGASHSQGKYLLFLDADDQLAPGSLVRLTQALDANPGLHIAYGGMALINDDGTPRGDGGNWPGAFDWRQQMAHLNQLTYCALMRREVWEETGGYRIRDWRAEDAAFWCRATSFGFRAAKVTDTPVLVYRLRSDSKSQQEYREHPDKDGDWTAGFPWATAHSGLEGREKRRAGQIEPPVSLVPFGAQGEPRGRRAWPVFHHQHPAVSVIIPCGPGHQRYLIDALDSLVAQDVTGWEAIVINDTGDAWLEIPGAPWAQVINPILPPYDDEGYASIGPGAARNLGLEHARAPLCLFLDADDWLVPGALRALLERYAEGDASYVYSDWLRVEGRQETPHQSPEYTRDAMFSGLFHPVTVLMATEAARGIGFDADLQGWEDWDFFIRLATEGYCGARVALPLLAYRLDTGTMRKRSQKQAAAIKAEIKQRYGAYTTGATEMASCCGGNGAALLAARAALEGLMADEGIPTPQAGAVLVEYIGLAEAPVTYTVNGRGYRMGRGPLYRYAEVPQEDVGQLLALGGGELFKVVQQPKQEAEPEEQAVEAVPRRSRRR